jgi:prepilin-type N-terminal cleavage/methylation domain-containing protein
MIHHGRVLRAIFKAASGSGQSGMTMIELVMALAVTAIIGTAVTAAVAQVFDTNVRSSNHMVAVRQVQNAGYWFSRDAQMAQSVDTSVSGKLVRLQWTDFENTLHTADYTLVDGASGLKDLERDIDGDVVVVGQFIDPDETSVVFAGGKLALTVTASVGNNDTQGNETRIYEIKPRPQ